MTAADRQLDLPGMWLLVECCRDGRRLRVVPASPGYPRLNVAFPRALRADGARFWVRGLRNIGGKYYRASGPYEPAAAPLVEVRP